MAVAPLVASPPLSAADGLRQIHGVLDRIEVCDAPSGPTAAARILGELERAVARLQAVKLRVVARTDHQDVAGESGLSGTGAWLAATTRSDGARAATEVRLAGALEAGLPSTRAALASGELSVEHAQVIASSAAQLPEGLDADERRAIETALVARAKVVDPATLRKAARRALGAARRSQAEVDAHEDALLRDEEERARARTRLSLHDNGDGTTSGHFTVPTLAAAILRKAVQQMASPRRFADRAARQGAVTAGAQLEAFREVDWTQRYGQAFTELLEHLPTDRLSGKVAATVVVTIDHERLKESLGAGHADTGTDLSASQARRLACNCGILPAVLGRGSLPVDLGRQDRFFSEAQRVALAGVYEECAATGCDRPYAWCELHHEDPWASGGRTDLALAVPLCGHHHRRVHDPTYLHRIETGPTGRKTVLFTRRS